MSNIITVSFGDFVLELGSFNSVVIHDTFKQFNRIMNLVRNVSCTQMQSLKVMPPLT